MCTSTSTHRSWPQQQLQHIKQPTLTTMMYCTALSMLQNKDPTRGRQSASLKNDICWCWATFSPPGNNRVFKKNKFKDQWGRVRQILEGAISKVKMEQGKVITLVDITGWELPKFVYTSNRTAEHPGALPALTEGRICKENLQEAPRSTVCLAQPLWNKCCTKYCIECFKSWLQKTIIYSQSNLYCGHSI